MGEPVGAVVALCECHEVMGHRLFRRVHHTRHTRTHVLSPKSSSRAASRPFRDAHVSTHARAAVPALSRRRTVLNAGSCASGAEKPQVWVINLGSQIAETAAAENRAAFVT